MGSSEEPLKIGALSSQWGYQSPGNFSVEKSPSRRAPSSSPSLADAAGACTGPCNPTAGKLY